MDAGTDSPQRACLFHDADLETFAGQAVGERKAAQPGAEARGTVRMAEIGSADTPVPLDGFALGPPAAVRSDRRRSVTVTADLTAPGFVRLAGMVLSGAPGHYAQFLADRRWSMSGFGDDGDPTPPDTVQRFRTADLAGYLAARYQDQSAEDAIRQAVAAGAASVLEAGAGRFDLKDFTRLAADVQIEVLDSAETAG